ncbi:MAG: hypothetical protein HYT61_02330 [Candidatus Yanofskybacteria bacterium]|nr:hypothetical protein [Candidatus Yanofskybacteria bacterium]
MALTESFLKKREELLGLKLRECLDRQKQALRGLVAIGEDGLRDSADLASTILDQEVNLHLANGCAKQIFKISQAILNIKNGNYGFCLSCKSKIPTIRLKAIPWATECLTCSKKDESKKIKHKIAD